MSTAKTNGARLWQRLMDMGAIGGTDKGGCNRQALTDLDKQGRELFIDWCRQAGCSIRVDAMGNVFARREGANADLPAVITGSHLDTQPTGGKFDGVYGVLAGLEVLDSLNDHQITTQHPVEVVVWTNEEGARFSPAMIGSGVWCGEFDLDYGHSRADKQGVTIGEELQRLGYLGKEACAPYPIQAAFELHIEQGPILEQEDLAIGVVSGVQGMRWYDLTLTGQPCHAGPSPMTSRRDPFMAMHPIMADLYALADEFGPWARVTFGDIKASPGVRNTVPEEIVLCVDLRHPDESVLTQMHDRFHTLVAERAAEHQIEADIRQEWHSPAVEFNADCVAAVRSAVDQLGYSNMNMFSGAGHDAVYVSRVAPTSMIFIPCKDGISHNEAEDAQPAHIEAGANVLLHAILQQAQTV